MNGRLTPWAVFAAVLMIGFLVWLGAQMTRTERGDQVLITIVVCSLLAGMALAAGAARRRRRHRR